MITALLGLISGLIDVYKLLIVAYVIVELLHITANRWTELLRSVVEPALTVVRPLMHKYLPRKWMPFDWSPVALFLVLSVVQWVL